MRGQPAAGPGRGELWGIFPKAIVKNPPQPLNLCCPPDVGARFRPPNKTKSVAADAKGDGWQGADRNWPLPNPRRRRLITMGLDARPAGGRTWPRGAMGYLPQ